MINKKNIVVTYFDRVKQQGGFRQRFIIDSPEELAFVMKTSSAQELENVDLAIHLSEALSAIVSSGRGRQIVGSIGGTIACVTGFLMNLPEKTSNSSALVWNPNAGPLATGFFPNLTSNGQWTFSISCNHAKR